ncbi:hypothetical protein [Reichenbachiella versicolor]|uniref:hypothetical protein n=1 Tax=Reichenbachiella versicolor TaxID=1821036 RepID=UPI000D6E1A4F|nr:hypothetical protein [Reichenbachiella versicolor]
MEDQEIKDLWQSAGRDARFKYSEETLAQVISKGSQSVVHKFVKTLKVEQIVNVIAFLTWVAYFVWFGQYWGALGALVLNVGFYVGYKRFINRLDIPNAEEDVIGYLYKVEGLVKQFVGHYKKATVVLGLPVYLLVLRYSEGVEVWDKLTNNWTYILINLVGLVVAYVVVLWMIHLFYGRKLHKIQELIKSLQESE